MKRETSFRSVICFALMAVMVVSLALTAPVYAATWDTSKTTMSIDRNIGGMTAAEQTAYKKLYAKKSTYPEGTPWGNNKTYTFHGGIYGSGAGCSAFAFMMSDAAFGTKKGTKKTITKSNVKALKVGDIVRMNDNTHSVIIMKANSTGTKFTIAEGNYNGTVHWGRTITRAEILESGTYILTRY